MMRDDPSAFPESAIRPRGDVSRAVRGRGLTTLREAIRFVRDLPYGRPTDRGSALATLEEGVGTCSTKHALLARLCDELGLSSVQLTLGIYEMTERNTPGVGDVLEAHGLEALPEAHCYLVYDGERFDFTRSGDGGAPIERLLLEEPIRPGQIGEYKTERHRAFLADWIDRVGLDRELAEVWIIRERCIEALSRANNR